MSPPRFNLRVPAPILAIALFIGYWHGFFVSNFTAEAAAHNSIFSFEQDENFNPTSTSVTPDSSTDGNPSLHSSNPSPSLSSRQSLSRSEVLSATPSAIPSTTLSANPSKYPSSSPSDLPSTTSSPTNEPSISPSESLFPTYSPSVSPSDTPTESPSDSPSTIPSDIPSTSSSPSDSPSDSPSTIPSDIPSTSSSPSDSPSDSPSTIPSDIPSTSSSPSDSTSPTDSPSDSPTDSPSTSPSAIPSESPTTTNSPSVSPSNTPSLVPSDPPSDSPSTSPTDSPSNSPIKSPSDSPSNSPSDSPSATVRPNLLVIMTDEQNLRTIGAYRKYFRDNNQGYMARIWGPGNEVKTPHIDKLAEEGAIFTNFYSPAPICTPSRASFISGLYPKNTGAHLNIVKSMWTSVKTWAHYLDLLKYQTSYMGKWHLDGEVYPGVFSTVPNKNRRKFGFKDNFFRFNDGHEYKFLNVKDNLLRFHKFKEDFEGKDKPDGIKTHFTTDFLFDKARKEIEKSLSNSEPFALMLSIPDPHNPNQVRPPYDTMYNHMDFEIPASMRARYQGFNPYPEFADNKFTNGNKKNDVMGHTWPLKTNSQMQRYENTFKFQNHMSQYFGMVKCIDDNLGNLMNFIKNQGIEDNTIVVFTSDHGDMLFEHGKINKSLPYKASMGVPFIIKYPKKILPGKVVETARSLLDFAPTILRLMDVEHSGTFDGRDFSDDLLSNQAVVNDESNVVFSSHNGWVAAVSSRLRLVIGKAYSGLLPWLFDMEEDPRELVNKFDDMQYRDAKELILEKLLQEFNNHKRVFPRKIDPNAIWYWNRSPACMDSKDKLPIDPKYYPAYCSDLGGKVPMNKCSQWVVRTHCPVSCNSCCSDTSGVVLYNYSLHNCGDLRDKCDRDEVKAFCPVTCGYGECTSW